MFDIICWRLWISLSVLWWSMAGLEASMTEQRFAIEPQDQTCVVGTRVALPCRVINKLGSLQWTRDDFALGTHRSLTEFFRYSMIGSDEEGDFSLAIEPVMLDDDAKYQCQVSSGPNGEPGIRSRYARLVVLVPPEPPRIIQGGELEMTEDSEVKLECVSQNGKPAAEITWIDGLRNVIRGRTPFMEIENFVEHNPESRLYTAKSVLTIRLKKEHHNTSFTCQAQNAAERSYQSAKIDLRVKYAPKVVVSVVPNTGTRMLVEGSEAKLVCQADANPPALSFRWYLNGEQKFSSNPNELIIRNVSRSYHDHIVKCETQNTVGKSEDSQTLEVTYAPKFIEKPQSVQADPNSTVQLSCKVEGNPPPEITWTHGRDKIVGNSPNLTLTVNRESVGRYYCRAIVPGFPEIGGEAYVRMNGRPSIQKNSVQHGVVGETVRLECSAYSVPHPDKIRWSFNGQTIDSTHQDYTVIEDLLAEGVRSTLVIRNSRQIHYGTYNCLVANHYGRDTIDILLKPQKGFPLTTVLTAAVGGGGALVALILIILMCQRKESKPHSTIEDKHIEKQCKESDKSSSISELKLEMRTGSSASNINCESDYGGGRDSDSIATRVAVPLAEPVPVDQQYSMSRYSSDDFRDPMFLTKTGQSNNGYVSYLDYSRSSTMTPTNGISPIVPSSTASSLTSAASLDLRYSAVYGNPYLRIGSHPAALPTSGETSCSQQPVPPPPYTILRNGSAITQLTSTLARSKSSSPATSSLSQYLIPASKTTPQHIRTKEAGTTQQATHV